MVASETGGEEEGAKAPRWLKKAKAVFTAPLDVASWNRSGCCDFVFTPASRQKSKARDAGEEGRTLSPRTVPESWRLESVKPTSVSSFLLVSLLLH